VTAGAVKLRDRNWGLIWMPPAWVFLVESLFWAAQFKSALTYQVAAGRYDFPRLNDALFLQVELFKYALAPLLVLAFWYLVARLLLFEDHPRGRVDSES